MKRFFAILLAALLLAAVLCVPASAAKYEPVAEELSAIGMLKGTGDGFELDKVPNRAQAAVMLVRLFGAEEEAQADYEAGKIASPFKDVSWDAPYAAWLYTKGLTKGVSATEFGSALPCSAHDYAVFMLRTLGYQDGADFEYADASDFAAKKGFFLSALIPGDFKRDDLAAVTYQALATEVKGGGQTLLEKLVQDGAVDEKAAKPMLDKFSTYEKLNGLMGEGGAMDADLKLSMNISTVESGITMTIPMTLDGNIKVAAEDTDILKEKVAMAFKAAALDEEIEMKLWLQEGWCYIDLVIPAEEGTEELKFKMDMSPMQEMLAEYDTGSLLAENGAYLLSFFKSVTTRETSTDTLYECVISGDALEGLVQEILESIGMADGMQMDIGDVKVVYTVRADKLLSMTEEMTMKVSAEGQDVTVTMDMSFLINSLGSSVAITYPDFSDYIDMGAEMADLQNLGSIA